MDKHKEGIDFEISFYEGVLKNSPDYIDALMPLAEAYTSKGMHQKGLAADQHLAMLCPEDPVIHYNLACSYALTAQSAKAIETLRKAVRLGWCDFSHMAKDEDLASLHKLPEFLLLLNAKKK